MAVVQMQGDDDFVLSGEDDVEGNVQDGDSGILEYLLGEKDGLKFITDGSCTTVLIHGVDLSDAFSIAFYREEVYQQLIATDCKLLRFDLIGIQFLPSGMLGLLASVKKRGVDVEVEFTSVAKSQMTASN